MRYITVYNPEWRERFQKLACSLRPSIPDVCTIHHVGSTSIPGMPAKDIIDVIIECPSGAMQEIIAALNNAGYEHEGDLGIPTREAFRPLADKPASELPKHHLYACESGSPEMQKMIAFRDYLRTHTNRAQWLGARKIACDAAATSRDDYIEQKAPDTVTLIREALLWNAARGT